MLLCCCCNSVETIARKRYHTHAHLFTRHCDKKEKDEKIISNNKRALFSRGGCSKSVTQHTYNPQTQTHTASQQHRFRNSDTLPAHTAKPTRVFCCEQRAVSHTHTHTHTWRTKHTRREGKRANAVERTRSKRTCAGHTHTRARGQSNPATTSTSSPRIDLAHCKGASFLTGWLRALSRSLTLSLSHSHMRWLLCCRALVLLLARKAKQNIRAVLLHTPIHFLCDVFLLCSNIDPYVRVWACVYVLLQHAENERQYRRGGDRHHPPKKTHTIFAHFLGPFFAAALLSVSPWLCWCLVLSLSFFNTHQLITAHHHNLGMLVHFAISCASCSCTVRASTS